MSRAFLTTPLSAAILIAFAVPVSVPGSKGLSGSAQAGYTSDRKGGGSDTKPSVKKPSTSSKKKGTQDPAGIAVSDPGSEGSKPVKGGKK